MTGSRRPTLRETGRARRARVLRDASEVPSTIVVSMLRDVVTRLDGGAAARRCEGLTLRIEMSDRDLPAQCIVVGAAGRVRLLERTLHDCTFRFRADTATIDEVLSGRLGAIRSILAGRVAFCGSLQRLRSLLGLLPELQQAYAQSRRAHVDRYFGRYVFAF